jgi:hypothetical protein
MYINYTQNVKPATTIDSSHSGLQLQLSDITDLFFTTTSGTVDAIDDGNPKEVPS